MLDAGDVLSLLRQCQVDLVLSGHRHVPYASGRSRARLHAAPRGFPNPAYNLIRVEAGRISVDLCVPRGEQQSLGDYPRDWPPELSARHADPFVRAQRGVSLAEDETTTPRA